jgi:phosphoribosylglycinamide formyltransferase 2
LAGTQNLSEFELHARAILGLPIPQITLERAGVSAVILANKSATEYAFEGVSTLLATPNTNVRLFGKPTTRPYRRMGVVLIYDDVNTTMNALIEKAKALRDEVSIKYLGN